MCHNDTDDSMRWPWLARQGQRAESSEDALWRDAYGIAWIGASNAVAVQNILDKRTAEFGTDHVAVRAIAGHLAYLRGESLGPSFEELDAVLENGKRLGIHRETYSES